MNQMALTASNFSEILDKHEIVLLDFWAKWCEPCKAFSKVVEQVAPLYPQVLFASIDIGEEHELAQDFNIRAVPMVMILKQRVAVYAESGALTAVALRELLDEAMTLSVDEL